MKYARIEDHRGEFSVSRMRARLKVSRSGSNQWRGRKTSDRARSNEQLDAAVVKLHAAMRRRSMQNGASWPRSRVYVETRQVIYLFFRMKYGATLALVSSTAVQCRVGIGLACGRPAPANTGLQL